MRVLGPDHPDTLRARHNHAWNVGETGERGRAARLLTEVITDYVRVLGPDHPATLRARSAHARNVGEGARGS
ncbi:hypothetical protein GCM10023080_022570 [Streptomyces pseudoechinosporeus]